MPCENSKERWMAIVLWIAAHKFNTFLSAVCPVWQNCVKTSWYHGDLWAHSIISRKWLPQKILLLSFSRKNASWVSFSFFSLTLQLKGSKNQLHLLLASQTSWSPHQRKAIILLNSHQLNDLVNLDILRLKYWLLNSHVSNGLFGASITTDQMICCF